MYPYRLIKIFGPLLVVVILFTFIILIHIRSVFAETCTIPGTRPATADDAIVKNGQISVGTCYNPNDQYLNQNEEQAKQDLANNFLIGAAATRGAKSATQMMPAFACRLDRFLNAAKNAGYSIKIFSGWRDGAAQEAAASTARPGYACTSGSSCPHPQGRAADLTFNGVTYKSYDACYANAACKWAQDNAKTYNLVFPLRSNPIEPWHIEPTERSGLSRSAKCDGAPGAAAPVSATAYTQTPTTQICAALGLSCGQQQNQCPSGYTYSSTYGSCIPQQQQCPQGTVYSPQYGICAPLQGQQQAPQQQAQQQPQQSSSGSSGSSGSGSSGYSSGSTGSSDSSGGSGQICTPSFSCSGSTVYYNTTSCTKQIYKLCSNGCNAGGTDCMGTSTLATSTQSAGDLLNSFLNGDTGVTMNAVSVGTATPITLNSNVSDILALAPPLTASASNPAVATGTPDAFAPIGTSTVTIQPRDASQTFTSQDLQYAPAGSASGGTFGGTSTLAILESVKSALAWIWQRIQPFSGLTPPQGTSD